MRRKRAPPYNGKPLSDLPTEVLINIFLRVRSTEEVESLGLTCTRFYEIFRDFGYTSLCRIQRQLWKIQTSTYKPFRSSHGLRQRLAAVAESGWSTQLISRSVCDAVANSRRGHIIRRGCREWAKKEDILIYHVQTIWKRKDAEAIGYWTTRQALYPIKRLDNFILPHQLFYFSA
jgi:hypothetical protein